MSESDRDTYSNLSNANLRIHVNKTGKNISANTSKATGQRGSGGEFGGYESYAEWAQKDPKGYVQANNTLQGNNIKIGY